ncbi:AraC family transcriptional regulator [Lactococcus lactis]|uniref:AraC family transcriptional regulator n=1 Tax=Lactococcus lactis TaxID=1358 RepID=UPI00223B4DEA|nr:AraC family transcriptional regulator [Lactococcus lactis]
MQNVANDEFQVCEVGYEKCQPTKPFEYASIDYWVLHYCTDGEGYFSTSDSPKYHITQGDLFLIPANCHNKYYPSKTKPWSYRWVGFSGINASKYLKSLGFNSKNCVLQSSVDEKLNTLFELIYLGVKEKNDFSTLRYSYTLFEYLAQKVSKHNVQSTPERLFKEIILYIDEKYMYDLSVNEIAQYYEIDRTYIYRLFRRYKRTTPSKYIQELRLKKACSLLKKSSLTITEISYSTGFSSPSYFSKFFVSKMKMTPLSYRRSFLESADGLRL